MDSVVAATRTEPMGKQAGTSRGPAQGGQQQGARSRASPSNLESFFAHSAPAVPTFAHPHLPSSPYFRLADVWASMNEWSAYGVEVPLRVPGDVGDVVQCYVPYLSAVQLFDASAKHRSLPSCSRGYCSDEDMDIDSLASDSGSDCSGCSSSIATDSDSDDPLRCGGRWGAPGSALTRSCESGSVLRSSSLLGEPARSALLFEFYETCSPHNREPLTDRIARLSAGPGGFAGLTDLRSCDIHPASWFSVAWYPLYRLPASGRTIRDLNACFLTFHSLASPLPAEGKQGSLPADGRAQPPGPSAAAAAAYQQRREAAQVAIQGAGHGVAVLQPFAFVPYKMVGKTWEDDFRSHKLQLQMVAAAGAWVQRRSTSHPDLDFFLSNLRPASSRSRAVS